MTLKYITVFCDKLSLLWVFFNFSCLICISTLICLLLLVVFDLERPLEELRQSTELKAVVHWVDWLLLHLKQLSHWRHLLVGILLTSLSLLGDARSSKTILGLSATLKIGVELASFALLKWLGKVKMLQKLWLSCLKVFLLLGQLLIFGALLAFDSTFDLGGIERSEGWVLLILTIQCGHRRWKHIGQISTLVDIVPDGLATLADVKSRSEESLFCVHAWTVAHGRRLVTLLAASYGMNLLWGVRRAIESLDGVQLLLMALR